MAVQKTIIVTTSEWISVNNTGEPIGVGQSMKLQSQIVAPLKMTYSTTQPSADDFSGETITNLTKYESSKIIPSDTDEVWIRNSREGEWSLKIFVQEWTL